MRRAPRRFPSAIAALCLCTAPIPAQEAGSEPPAQVQQSPASAQSSTLTAGLSFRPPQAEAPTSIFATELGGAEVELLVKGSWEASLASQAMLVRDSGGGFGSSTIQPLLFAQTPDLYISFLLFERLFVEARVTDDISQARYSAGYIGAEGETLRELRLGNDKISFPALPFLSFGSGSHRSFGMAAKAGTGDFQGLAMLRYDQARRVVKRFVGKDEVSDSVVSVFSFARGRWFSTPEAPAVNLRVFVESGSGTLEGPEGSRFRELGSGEFSYSAATGLVSLAKAAETRVAASYDGALAADFAVGGRACVLLYDPSAVDDPGRQILSRYYTAAEPAAAEAFLRDTRSGLRDLSFQARIDERGFIELIPAGSGPRDETYLRPLEPLMPWLYTTDFTDDGPKDYAPNAIREIVLRTRSDAEHISIEKDVIEGSVEVLRDGSPDYAFSLDADQGRLLLATPPGLTEEIEVSYLRESSERRSGSLAAALGGFWNLGTGRSAWAALGLRWALPGASYSAEGESDPGALSLALGERDEEGKLRQKASIAASYTRELAANRYRVEGMESASSFASSFRPAATGDAAAAELVETGLASSFPELLASVHADGSLQKALRIRAGPAGEASFMKIIEEPPFLSLKTLTFFARGPETAALRIAFGDGSADFLRVELPAGSLRDRWRRFSVEYGAGDLAVYAQEEEGGEALLLGSAAAVLDLGRSSSSEILVEAEGMAEAEELWIDEILLEDSTGRVALLFQGDLSYAEGARLLGSQDFPVLSAVEIKADLTAALHDSTFASGGAALGGALGPLYLGLRARGTAIAGERMSLRGGHSLRLPSGSFPLRIEENFDFNPETGGFGREEKASLSAGSLASLELRQGAAWIPSEAIAERGSLEQQWEGSLSLAGGIASASLKASNRARPSSMAAGSSYGIAWLGSYQYLLPAFEADSERRAAEAALKLKTGRAEFASFRAAFATEPSGAGASKRAGGASARLGLPFALGGIKIEPYYLRAWEESCASIGGGIVGEAAMLAEELAAFDPFYRSLPLVELWEPGLGERFALASSSDAAGAAPVEALYAPEIGLRLSREFGSRWYDLLAPSSLGISFARSLARSSDTLTDSAAFELEAKFAAINLFGSAGAYPAGLGFESDEYLVSIQAALVSVRGEDRPRAELQSQHLATFYAGAADSLLVENRVLVSSSPSSSEWSEKFKGSWSRRVSRHWLLDLYRLVLPAAPPSPAGVQGGDPPLGASAGSAGAMRSPIASLYLEDIARRPPVLRSTLSFEASVSGGRSDEAEPPPDVSVKEAYEAKLTVPERLTLLASLSLAQDYAGESGDLALGLELKIGLTLSF